MSDVDKGPKSMCKCGHAGDGEHSDHAGAIGHGKCFCCNCVKFTWQRHLTAEEVDAWIMRDMANQPRQRGE